MSKVIETERKFIVKIPDLSPYRGTPAHTASLIHQTYLISECGVTRRIRRREYADRVEYYETKKTRISEMSAIEEETGITKQTYESLIKERRPDTVTLRKLRETVTVDGLTYEFDVYPAWSRTCIMEVELPSEDSALPLPAFVEVVREVTGQREYTNASMAKHFPPESL